MILMNVIPTARNMQMEDSLETFPRCIPRIPDRKPVQHTLATFERHPLRAVYTSSKVNVFRLPNSCLVLSQFCPVSLDVLAGSRGDLIGRK